MHISIAYAEEKAESTDTYSRMLANDCGGGMSAAAESNFQEVIDMTSHKLPKGHGIASSRYSAVMLEIIREIEDEANKTALLFRYFDCVDPLLKKN